METTQLQYGKAFALWQAAAQQHNGAWQAYTQHPFVEGMRDGSLDKKFFLHYLKQDYVFLVHFARAWALAVVKSETLDEMQYACVTMNSLINFEMQHHVEICAHHGIDEQALFKVVEAPENVAYTRYVIDAGLSGDLVDLLATLAPCILGYGEIGARLAPAATPDNPYCEWIKDYADEEYQQVCRQTGQLLDNALARRIGADFEASPRWQRLCERFTTATRLEVGFWDMSLQP